VSSLEAQRTANSYLLTTVAPGIETASPILIPDDPPIWRMRVRVCQRGLAGAFEQKPTVSSEMIGAEA
jgi:hypothetical protein